MTASLKPLRECIRNYNDSKSRGYEAATIDSLTEVIISCDSKLLTERVDGHRVDAFRTIAWYANLALTKKGVSPRSRKCLGPIPSKSTRLLHDIRKQDAPYLDLQWLAFKYADHVPSKWSGIRMLLASAPNEKHVAEPSSIGDDDIVFAESDWGPDEMLDIAFSDADRLITRRITKSKLCMALKLNTAAQSEMRWLCSRNVNQVLRDLDQRCDDLRVRMKQQGIKQLTPDLIDGRLQTYRAWKLAGGGTKWQATADLLAAMTGSRISRQAVKDMITRLGEQKIIRRRRGRIKKIEPILL